MLSYLKSSAGTGKKILNNWPCFTYSYKRNYSHTISDAPDGNANGVCYQFDWTFNEQHGIASIVVNADHIIVEDSLITTSPDSMHPFDKTLGYYNDSSLHDVFVRMPCVAE